MTAATSPAEDDDAFIFWLCQPAGGGHIIALQAGDQFVGLYHYIFTVGIQRGRMHDRWGYDERWCYASLPQAIRAFARWGAGHWKGEPQGWTRHMPSGRRGEDIETLHPKGGKS